MHKIIEYLAPRIGSVVKYKSLRIVVVGWAMTDSPLHSTGRWTYAVREKSNSILFYDSNQSLQAVPIEDLKILTSVSIDADLYNLLLKTNSYLSSVSN